MASMFPCGDTIGTVPKVLPEKQCGTERVLLERLARPTSQACTRIAWQPPVPGPRPRRAHRKQAQNLVQRRASRAPTRELFTRKN